MRFGLVDRADRNSLVEVRGIPDRKIRVHAENLVALLKLEVAFVARGEHHDDALPPQLTQLLADGRVTAAERLGIEWAAQAQIHPMDQQRRRVAISFVDMVERLDDLRVAADAIVVEHFVASEPHVRRDARDP
jgi:hypothetical protein